MIVLTNILAYSDADKYIHKLGTETYSKKITLLPNDTLDDFEEVDDIPKYTKEEYKTKVRELIARQYTIEDELALHRQKDIKSVEWDEYNRYCEECKIEAKNILNNKEYGKEI